LLSLLLQHNLPSAIHFRPRASRCKSETTCCITQHTSANAHCPPSQIRTKQLKKINTSAKHTMFINKLFSSTSIPEHPPERQPVPLCLLISCACSKTPDWPACQKESCPCCPPQGHEACFLPHYSHQHILNSQNGHPPSFSKKLGRVGFSSFPALRQYLQVHSARRTASKGTHTMLNKRLYTLAAAHLKQLVLQKRKYPQTTLTTRKVARRRPFIMFLFQTPVNLV